MAYESSATRAAAVLKLAGHSGAAPSKSSTSAAPAYADVQALAARHQSDPTHNASTVDIAEFAKACGAL